MSVRPDSESMEKLRLLGELAHEDSKAPGFVSSTTRRPDWAGLEQSGRLTKGSGGLLSRLDSLSIAQRCETLCQDGAYINGVLDVFESTQVGSDALLYMAELLVDVARTNTWVWDAMRNECHARNPAAIMFKCFMANQSQMRLAGLLAAASTALISHGGVLTPETQTLISQILENVKEKRLMPIAAVVSLGNILKMDCAREAVAHDETFSRLIRKCLHHPEDSNLLYAAVFAIWQISCNATAALCLKEKSILESFCDSIHTTRREKVVRVACYAISNLANYDWAIEVFGAKKTPHALSLLEYEKWRDDDLYADLRDLISKLSRKLTEMSNFDRYKRELDSGRLHWSPLHAEKFWAENYRNFETNEFKAVKTLMSLLSSSDSTTLAVTCFDLGEFARLHPTAKTILARLRTKEAVMQLMNHPNRDVSREALLCVQKLMLDNWRQLGGDAQEKHGSSSSPGVAAR